jgi:Tfp pilus assembly protein PilZ
VGVSVASNGGENRKKRRFYYETAVALEGIKGGVTSVARMFNVSEGGVYFESDTLIADGKPITLWIANSPFASNPGVYESHRVQVVWRSPLKDSIYAYGYGVKRLDPVGTFAESMVMSRFELPRSRVGRLRPMKDSRLHPRKTLSKSVYFASQNEHYKGVIQNISRSGLFIETWNRFEVGRSVRIVIPDDRFDQYLSVTARVVRSAPDGIGLKITRVAKRLSP